MHKLTLRQQLVGGFLLVAILTTIVGAIGFFGTRGLATTFTQYRATARQSLLVDEVNGDLATARLDGFRWRANGDPAIAQQFEARIAELIELLDEAELSAQIPEAEAYLAAFRQARSQQAIRDTQAEIMAESGLEARLALTDVTESAYADEDTEASFFASRAREHLLLARLYAERFLVSNLSEDAQRARSEIGLAREALGTLLPLLQNTERRARTVEAQQQIELYAEAIDATVTAILTRNQYLAEMDAIGPAISAAAGERRAANLERQNTLGPQAQADAERTQTLVLAAVIAGALAAIALGLVFAGQISRALGKITTKMGLLADGDTSIEIEGANRADEIGHMARALEIFRDNTIKMEEARAEASQAETRAQQARREAALKMADAFESSVGGIVQALAKASEGLEANARELNSAVSQSGTRSSSVAAAAVQASAGVEAVASAAEELTASIQEVSSQVSSAATAARSSSDHARVSSEQLDRLNEAIVGVDEIIRSITGVAEQTNLLALNATIEAARAGEAGKGFAVVASEVKTLARQTQTLTDEIDSQLKKIGQAATDAIGSTREIIGRIREIDDTSSALAAAVEEQTSATSEISASAQQAALGARTVSGDITGVQSAVSDSEKVARTVDQAASALRAHSDTLQREVADFLQNVRAA